ncbi:unnamed protein product [Phaeothamnion confervicola]
MVYLLCVLFFLGCPLLQGWSPNPTKVTTRPKATRQRRAGQPLPIWPVPASWTASNRPAPTMRSRRSRLSALLRLPRFRRSSRDRDEEKAERLRSAPREEPCRTVSKVERYPRLPVWPVQNGLFFFLLDLLRLTEWAHLLEQRFGGRVCPMALQAADADPFVLLAHHRHSFHPWDPIRPIFRFFLPEGFPAHPHRGFSTVTYVLKVRSGESVMCL